MKIINTLAWSLVVCCTLITLQAVSGTKVKMQTSQGDLLIELDDSEAPQTVANFLKYVNAGFYEGTVFHRVIPRFVIQGGGFLPGFTKPTLAELDTSPIANEGDNGLKNVHYSLSMARTNDPHSATSQFFINLNDNANLDHTGKTASGWGYAVFGRVIEGMAVVDEIATAQTTTQAQYQDVPVQDIVVTSASVVR